MSLVHKEAHVVCSGYSTKPRPWSLGVADPGTGKSHAPEPHSEIVEEVCHEMPDRAVGMAQLDFHVIKSRTYAAFEDTIKDTQGYGLLLCGEGKPLLSPTFPRNGTFDDAHGLPFDRLMDAAYGKRFGGDTKGDRQAAKRKVESGLTATSAAQKQTNICIGLIIQDSAYRDWLVAGEATHHEGLSQRLPLTFGKGRMVGALKHSRFAETVYFPLVKEIFRVVLKRFSPRHMGVCEKGNKYYSVFDFSDSEERLIKNIRVVCRYAESLSSTHSVPRRKFAAGLSKVGYPTPGVAWENTLFGDCFDHALCDEKDDKPIIHTRIPFPSLAGALFYVAYRFVPPMAILDNDIHRYRHGTYKEGVDPRDHVRTEAEVQARHLLLQCPANVLTETCVAWFCSPEWDSLKGRDTSAKGIARAKLQALFVSMEDWDLGRCQRTGAAVAFQKRHVESLPPSARDRLTRDLRIPLWVFGNYLLRKETAPPEHRGDAPPTLPPPPPPKEPPVPNAKDDNSDSRNPHLPSPPPRAPAPHDAVKDALDAEGATQDPKGAAAPRPPPSTSAIGLSEGATNAAESRGKSEPEASNVKDPSNGTSPTGDQKPAPSPAADAAEADKRDEKKRRKVWAHGVEVGRSTQDDVDNLSKHNLPAACQTLMTQKKLRTSFALKGSASGFWRLAGCCKEAQQCPVQYQARANFIPPVVVEIREFGGPHKHQGDVVGHGSIFLDVPSGLAAKQYAESRPAGTLTAEGLRNALRNHSVPSANWPTDPQMYDWIKRTQVLL